MAGLQIRTNSELVDAVIGAKSTGGVVSPEKVPSRIVISAEQQKEYDDALNFKKAAETEEKRKAEKRQRTQEQLVLWRNRLAITILASVIGTGCFVSAGLAGIDEAENWDRQFQLADEKFGEGVELIEGWAEDLQDDEEEQREAPPAVVRVEPAPVVPPLAEQTERGKESGPTVGEVIDDAGEKVSSFTSGVNDEVLSPVGDFVGDGVNAVEEAEADPSTRDEVRLFGMGLAGVLAFLQRNRLMGLARGLKAFAGWFDGVIPSESLDDEDEHVANDPSKPKKK